MTPKEPNPGEPQPEITFLDYLRNCRLGRAFARAFSGWKSKRSADGGPSGSEQEHDVEGGSVGLLARVRKTAVDGGLGPLQRAVGKATRRGGAPADTKAPAAGQAAPAAEAPPEPVPAVSLESVGSVLRRTRESYEEDLAAVAQTLHIRLAYLQAIEDQRFDKLPGPAYAVGFVRAYSDYLGLDSADMVRRFKIEVEGLDKRQELFFPTPVSESKVPGGAVILVSLLCVAIAYGAWFYLTSDERPVAEQVPPVPEELGGPPAEETVTAVAEPADQAAPPEGQPSGETVEAAVQPEAAETAEEAAPAEEADAEPAAPATGDAEETTAAAEAQGEQGSRAGQAIAAAIAQSVAPGSAEGGDEAAAGAQGDAAGEEGAARPAGDPDPAPGSEAAADQANAVSLARILRRPADLVPPQPEPPQVPQSAGQDGGGVPERAGAGRGASRQPLPGSPGIAVPAAEEGEIPRAPATEQLVSRTEQRTPQVFGAADETTRIVLRATQDSWVQIRDGNDDLLLTRVLRRGDEYRVPDQNGLTLLTGNAGGIEIVVDGAALSPLGPVGAVRRNIQLDAERLLEGTAIPAR